MPKILGTPTPRIYPANPKADFSSLILQVRYHFNGAPVRLRYFPGETVEMKYWDAKANRAKFGGARREEYAELNTRLNRLTDTAVSIWREHGRGNISPNDFSQELDFRLGRKLRAEETKVSFPDFLSGFLEEQKNAAGANHGTVKVKNLWISNLMKYAADRGRPLDYDSINWEFFTDFQNWLCTPPRQASLNYISRGLGIVRQLMREAERRGYHENTAYKEMKVRPEKAAKFALTFEELEKIYNLDLSQDKGLDKARDFLLIAAYTGLRYSDFSRIRAEHIIQEDGKLYLEITTKKTGTAVTIPLLEQAEAILSKYDFNPPKITDQYMNRCLKEVGKLAGLDDILIIDRTTGGKRTETTVKKYEKLSSHVGRRSFATNFFLLGLPAAMLMQITGHATEHQFMEYIAIDKRRNAKAMAREVAIKMADKKLKVV